MAEQMTQFKAEGQPAFPAKNEEKENSAASSAGEETDGDQTQSQGGDETPGAEKGGADDKGFADDPRWQQREKDWKDRFNEQETRHAGEITKLRDEFTIALKGGQQQAGDVPEWFGGDDKAWAKYQEHTNQIVSQAVTEALKQFSSRTDEEQKRIDDATAYFQSEAEAIEADKALNPQGLKLDRNKLLKTALDNDLVDSKGRWNYRAAFRFMKPSEVFAAKEAIQDRKQLANATTEGSKAEEKQPSVATSKDFANPMNRPW